MVCKYFLSLISWSPAEDVYRWLSKSMADELISQWIPSRLWWIFCTEHSSLPVSSRPFHPIEALARVPILNQYFSRASDRVGASRRW